MSLTPFSSQNGTLADRLNQRRRVRIKNGLDRTAVDESDLMSLRSRPTTMLSADRRSSQRTSEHSTFTSLGSSTPMINHDNTPAPDNHVKQKDLFITNGADATSLPEQRIRSQSLEPIHERESSAKSSIATTHQPPSDEAQEPVVTDEPLSPTVAKTAFATVSVNGTASPVVVEEVVPSVASAEVFPPAQQDKLSNSQLYHDEEPMMITKISSPKLPPVISPRTRTIQQTVEPALDAKSRSYEDVEPLSPKLPPLVAPRTTRKPNLSSPATRERPTLSRISDLSRTSLDCPSSDPQRTIDREEKHFDFPSTQPKPIARSASEQLVSTTRYRPQLMNATFAKQNSLALSYVFSRRIIAAEFASGSSLDSQQSRYKTAWD